ncbi:MAG: transporter substrate-binding domain-containing protein [Rhodocyclaceae bacterium]
MPLGEGARSAGSVPHFLSQTATRPLMCVAVARRPVRFLLFAYLKHQDADGSPTARGLRHCSLFRGLSPGLFQAAVPRRQQIRLNEKTDMHFPSLGRGLSVLILGFFFVTTAFADGQTITVSTNNTPLDRKTLESISQTAFRRLGMDFKLVSLPSERSLTSANLGEVDGEGLRVAGLENQYPNLIQVPERYVRISFVAFAKDATINLDNGWDSLKPYRVAFITGWKMFEANASGAKIVNKVDKAEQLFQMLDSGRVDLALYTKADGVSLVRNLGLSAIAPVSPALKDVDMYLYLNRKHAALVPKLAQVLREMKADGTYNRILSSVVGE